MNTWTKRGVGRSFIIAIVIISAFVLAFIFQTRAFDFIFFGFIICVVYYLVLKNKVHVLLQHSTFQAMGFEPISNAEVLTQYTFSKQYRLKIREVYRSNNTLIPCKLIRFTQTKGSGKRKVVGHYIGCEFETQQDHQAVQVYDQRNPFQPAASKDRQLESSEFNALFNIHSTDPSAPFYFLDPDTMSDLIDLKHTTGYSINLESIQHNIFLYVTANAVVKEFKSGLSFREVMNGQIDSNKLSAYQHSIEQFVQQMQTIFTSLDYKLKIPV